jgi:hypothetical protein
MLNYSVPSAQLKIISEGNTFIQHFAFCIQHSPKGSETIIYLPSPGTQKRRCLRSGVM